MESLSLRRASVLFVSFVLLIVGLSWKDTLFEDSSWIGWVTITVAAVGLGSTLASARIRRWIEARNAR